MEYTMNNEFAELNAVELNDIDGGSVREKVRNLGIALIWLSERMW